MKPRALLLAASVAVNAGLLATFILRPALVPARLRTLLPSAVRGDGAARRTREPGTAAPPTPAVATTPGVWAALHSTDLATLVARLRAAGFPPSMVRAIVDAEVERQFRPRIKELLRTIQETPYWKQDAGYYFGNSKLFEDVNAIYRERSKALRELLGKDANAFAGTDPTTAQRRQFGDLSPAKIELVQRINDDYAEMVAQIRSAMQGVQLPEDREKLALLEREKHADLAAILTPEELADYEMRASPVTSRLRPLFTIMDVSDAEFRKIYAAYEPFKDVLYPSYMGGLILSDGDKRREATRQVNEQLKGSLGEARFTEYLRASDFDFQQLYRLGTRDNVALDTLVRAFDIRNPTIDAGVKIIDNATLDPAAKLAALKDLAQDARTRLLGTLGPITGPSYADNSRWLNYLDQGRVLITQPDGSSTMRSIPPPRPAGAPAPRK